jgi:hypothetical protein
MIFITSAVHNQAPFQKNIKDSCVDVAADWFRWDDEEANKKAEDEAWAKFLTACDEATAATEPARNINNSSPPPPPPAPRKPTAEEVRRIQITEAIDASWDNKTARRNNLREHGIITDAEVAITIIGAHARPEDFATNKSSWSLTKLHANFCSLLPGANRKNPKAICGYRHEKKSPRPIIRAIFCRYIDIGHIPRGYNKAARTTVVETPTLRKLFAIDLDSNKLSGPFRKLFPEIDAAADIFKRHDIPRPLCAITNPLTKNAHAVYGVRYTREELQHPQATAAELRRIIKQITKWIGGDPGYASFVIRGPAYIAGWHKDDPAKECGKYIDTTTESIWHETTWFEPHLYSLDELRELATFLKALHTTATNPEFVAALGERLITPPTPRQKRQPDDNTTAEAGIISKGERNVTIFDLMRHYAYPIAWRFNNDTSALAQHLYEKFSRINADRCSPALPVCEIRASSYSVAKFCVTKGFVKPSRHINSRTSKGWTDEDRAYAHLIKYGPNYVTKKEIAATEGVCVRTITRRQAKAKKIEDARKRERCASAVIVNLVKKHPRDANGRIIYTSIPCDQSDKVETFMIRDRDSEREQIRTLVGVTARGPPS